MPDAIKHSEKEAKINNGLIEYYGPNNPRTILVAMGSLVGTIKDVIDEHRRAKGVKLFKSVGVLKIKSFRPFPTLEILRVVKNASQVAVLEKAISLGASDGPLTLDLKASLKNHCKAKVQGYVMGLGGRDITKQMIHQVIENVKQKSDRLKFVG